eukprot:TRINITY_DN699_c0_g1_i6.p1 TRINITY_DN699_c0_g1~~TRINITY_DN699_c0_g1_i6.p1  ORF type:complete len:164 (+),score=18.55 TRINITY_DN699_c0_g1_i6:977-1468(+)
MIPFCSPAEFFSKSAMSGPTSRATFAAGCFWGVESTFLKVKGVKETMVGYTGGATLNPTYKQVCADVTGHAEAIQIDYDPAQVRSASFYHTLSMSSLRLHLFCNLFKFEVDLWKYNCSFMTWYYYSACGTAKLEFNIIIFDLALKLSWSDYVSLFSIKTHLST